MQLLVWLTGDTETGDLDETGQLYRYQHFSEWSSSRWNLSSQSLFVTEDFWNVVKKGTNLQAFSDQSCLSCNQTWR